MKTEKCRVVYILWSTAVMGGLETVTALKVNELVKRGYIVSLITRRQGGRPAFAHIDERVEQIDIDVDWEQAYQYSNPIQRLYTLHKCHKLYRERILEQIARLSPNVVVLTSFSEAEVLKPIVGKLKSLLNPGGIILESHSSKYFSLNLPQRSGGLKGWIGKRLDDIKLERYERLPSYYDCFVSLTHEDKEQWSALNNLIVVPNPRRFETEIISDYHAKKVVAVGRYSKEKGHLDLIEIWGEVRKKHPDWTLEIVGDGPMRGQMLQKIDDLDLADAVVLYPATTDVVARLRLASIFAFSSYSEGFPMVLAEAQAVSLPIVSYACKCDPRDVISEGVDGFLISVGDKEGYVAKLCELIEDEPLRQAMGRAAKENSERYSLASVMDRWEQVFARLCEKS